MNKKEKLKLIREMELKFLVRYEEERDGTLFGCMMFDKFDEMKRWTQKNG